VARSLAPVHAEIVARFVLGGWLCIDQEREERNTYVCNAGFVGGWGLVVVWSSSAAREA
jgi:hypothetical protein